MNWIWSAALFAAGCAVLNAQDGKTPTMRATYIGCVEAINNGGSFVLTHVEADHGIPIPAGDSTETSGDQMMSRVVALTGRSDLRTHVGHKVMAAGALSHAMPDKMPRSRDSLALTPLKVLATSCS